jgi:hypothetical protein
VVERIGKRYTQELDLPPPPHIVVVVVVATVEEDGGGRGGVARMTAALLLPRRRRRRRRRGAAYAMPDGLAMVVLRSALLIGVVRARSHDGPPPPCDNNKYTK